MAAMLVQPLGPPVQPVRIENVEADRRAPGVVAQRTGVNGGEDHRRWLGLCRDELGDGCIAPLTFISREHVTLCGDDDSVDPQCNEQGYSRRPAPSSAI